VARASCGHTPKASSITVEQRLQSLFILEVVQISAHRHTHDDAPHYPSAGQAVAGLWPRCWRTTCSRCRAAARARARNVQDRDARAVDNPSEQRVMIVVVGGPPVPGQHASNRAPAACERGGGGVQETRAADSGSAPEVHWLVEDALPEPPDGFHHQVPLLCSGAARGRA
jgi:hypothetical protein